MRPGFQRGERSRSLSVNAIDTNAETTIWRDVPLHCDSADPWQRIVFQLVQYAPAAETGFKDHASAACFDATDDAGVPPYRQGVPTGEYVVGSEGDDNGDEQAFAGQHI